MLDQPSEQVIQKALVQCGLNSSGASVIYEDYLRSIEVVIKPEADAISEQFGCIRQAVGDAIVSFSDPDMDWQYRAFVNELLRPKALEDARQSLQKLGRLTNFPVRSAYSSDKLFAEAIEMHCGVPKGKALKEFDGHIAFMPPQEEYRDNGKFLALYECLTAGIIYVAATRELTITLIGNEALREQSSE